MTDDPEFARVPRATRERAYREALVAFDRVLKPFGLDPLARMDAFEAMLNEEYVRTEAAPPEPVN